MMFNRNVIITIPRLLPDGNIAHAAFQTKSQNVDYCRHERNTIIYASNFCKLLSILVFRYYYVIDLQRVNKHPVIL